MPKLVWFFAAIVLALGASACGGGDQRESEEFSAELNAICQDLRAEWVNIGEPIQSSAVVGIGQQKVEVLDEAIASVQELGLASRGPESSSFDDFRAKLIVQRELISAYVDANREGDIARSVDLHREVERLAEELGATACAEFRVSIE